MITVQTLLEFDLLNQNGKVYFSRCNYILVNDDGIWKVCASHGGVITFTLLFINTLEQLREHYFVSTGNIHSFLWFRVL